MPSGALFRAEPNTFTQKGGRRVGLVWVYLLSQLLGVVLFANEM
jgi:hypothetical protein